METRTLKSIKMKLASAEEITSRSGGEVAVESLYDDNGSPIPGGLFDPDIFGKEGKGFGHVTLAWPVVHPWYESAVRLLLDRDDVSDGRSVFDALKGLDLQSRVDEIRCQTDRKPDFASRCVMTIAKSGLSPETLVMTVLPVAPPVIRPVFSTPAASVSSDLNELYKRVISRNNALNSLLEKSAGKMTGAYLRDAIQRLTDAVQALIGGMDGEGALQSVTDLLESQNGFLKRNLEGKRVDYSGRSVIVSGPDLNLRQCGIPRAMALDQFKPFIARKMVENGSSANVYEALQSINFNASSKEVSTALDQVAAEKVVLLNRAPTHSRLSIQPFEPVIVDDKSIMLHPLACYGFNADFDGDQMAVHLPISNASQEEAKELLDSAVTLVSPANGKPVAAPVQDMVLGLWYLTADASDGKAVEYASVDEAVKDVERDAVHPHTSVILKSSGEETIETTAGRIVFNSILPREIRFINQQVDRSMLSDIVSKCLEICGREQTRVLLDDMNRMGLQYVTLYAPSYGLGIVPDTKATDRLRQQVLGRAKELAASGETSEENYERLLDLWADTVKQAGDIIAADLAEDQRGMNPIHAIVASGARANRRALDLSFGIAGMTWKTSDNESRPAFEAGSVSNFWDGFGQMDYFQRAFGARKGLLDTLLRSFDALSMMKRLIYVAQDIMISSDDCGTEGGIEVSAIDFNGNIMESLARRIKGRTAAEDIADSTGKVIVKAGENITRDQAEVIEQSGIKTVRIRSILTCQAEKGVCAKCYGEDLSYGQPVKAGTAVGVIAAEAIAEPAIQLTYRTFYPAAQKGMLDPTRFPGGLKDMVDIFGGHAHELTPEQFVEKNQQIFGFQGVEVDDKHFEILARRLYGFVSVEDPGDTDLISGDIVRKDVFDGSNASAIQAGGRPATGKPVMLGDHEAAAKASSVIGSAAVGDTVETLAVAALKGVTDNLESPLERIVAGLAPEVAR